MISANKFAGCRVLIRSDKAEEILADTQIVAYDKINIIITVNVSKMQNYVDERVSVLIFENAKLYEYGGTVRRYNGNGTTEIALFRGKEKEARTFRRYALKTKAIVVAVKEQERELLLGNPLEVELVNISATGVLFQTKKNFSNSYLKIHNNIRFVLNMNQNKMEMECVVVRMGEWGNEFIRYGCKFTTVQKK